MNRKIFAAAFALLVLSLGAETSLDARGVPPQKRYQVSVTWGGYPGGMSGLSNLYPAQRGFQFTQRSDLLSDLYSPYNGSVRTTGLISANFVYHFRTWFSLESSLGYHCVWAKTFSADDGRFLGDKHEHYVDLCAMARFTWVNRRYFRGYSSVGVCAVLGNPNGTMSSLYVFPQLDIVGLEFGKDVFGLLELGAGPEYFGAQIGVGYRF